jgi:Transposase
MAKQSTMRIDLKQLAPARLDFVEPMLAKPADRLPSGSGWSSMRKSKFSEHQIIALLKAVEAGRTIRDVCREHEISDATYYQ